MSSHSPDWSLACPRWLSRSMGTLCSSACRLCLRHPPIDWPRAPHFHNGTTKGTTATQNTPAPTRSWGKSRRRSKTEWWLVVRHLKPSIWTSSRTRLGNLMTILILKFPWMIPWMSRLKSCLPNDVETFATSDTIPAALTNGISPSRRPIIG